MNCWLLVLAALVATDPKPAQWLALGDEFLENHVYNEALRAFESASDASDGPCVACDDGRLKALLGLGRHAEAAELARRPGVSRTLLGQALIGRPGDAITPEALAEAEALFRELAARDVPDAGLYLGETLARGGEDAAARKILGSYLDTGPDPNGRTRARQLIALPHCGRRACLPAFEAEALDGTVWDNERLKGHVVLLDFWASWCRPCIDALPTLKTLAAEHADRPFILLSLSADSDPEALAAIVEGQALDWPQIRDADGSTIVGRFGVRNYPTYVLVDRSGVVRGRYAGEALTRGEIAEKIDELLEEGSGLTFQHSVRSVVPNVEM